MIERLFPKSHIDRILALPRPLEEITDWCDRLFF